MRSMPMFADADMSSGRCRTGSKAWELLSGLDVKPEDRILGTKRTYDAFQWTTLYDDLRALGVETVVVGGVMTNLCCESTARCARLGSVLCSECISVQEKHSYVVCCRSAFQHNFKVVMLSDGTATSTTEMQAATLKVFKFGFGEVLSCQEAVDLTRKMQSCGVS